MGFLKIAAIILVSFALASFSGFGSEAKIIKVLPHYIDKDGNHTVSPSLFARDAYQYHLRRNPEKCEGVRFDVQWKALKPEGLKVRVEMRGTADNAGKIFTIEKPLKKETFFGRWMTLKIEGDEFKKMGMLLAWRVTLWDGDKLLSEQKSFLW